MGVDGLSFVPPELAYHTGTPPMGLLVALLLIIVSCLIIWRASDGFEAASEYLGRNLSDGVRGATINAIGSSMPELFTTFFFFYYYAFVLDDPARANDGFSGGIGTTAGSAIFNGMIIPAIVIFAVIGYGLAKRVDVSRKVILRDGLSLIAAELVLIFVISGSTLQWWHGLILMLTYGVYIVVTFATMGRKQATSAGDDVEEFYENTGDGNTALQLLTLDLAPVFVRDKISKRNAWPLLLFSVLIIGLACFLLVYSCEIAALSLGVNTYFVAVIIASAATSVPDTILSYRDAMDGEYDDAVANALGSNIFDVCFALGFPLFLFTAYFGEISMANDVVNDVTELRVLLVLLTVAAFLIYVIGKGMRRIKAVLLLLIYVAFTAYIVSKANEVAWALDLGVWLRELVR